MTTYNVQFFRKEKDEKGRVKDAWCGTIEVSMMPHEQIPIAAKAFRQAPEKCSSAHRVVVKRIS